MESLNENDMHEGSGIFPQIFLEDLILFLKINSYLFETITYRDLFWENDYEFKNMYKNEWARWNKYLKNNKSKSRKIYILLQHDVDSCPEQSNKIAKLELDHGITSNIMVFNNRINRTLLDKKKEINKTDYNIDTSLYKKLDESGFTIGYHCNAYEQSFFNLKKALDFFKKDIQSLRRLFSINFFSPHGGVKDADGRSNNFLNITSDFQAENDIRWVHNLRAPSFDGSFSDGGLGLGLRAPNTLNLIDFMKSLQPGKRYRILLHPQYYGSIDCVDKFVAPSRSSTLNGVTWYKKILFFYTLENNLRRFLHIHNKSRTMPNLLIWGKLGFILLGRKYICFLICFVKKIRRKILRRFL